MSSQPDNADHYFNDMIDEEECWNCGGEGLVYMCIDDGSCMYPEEGCDLCERRCDVCAPTKPNKELSAILLEALTAPDTNTKDSEE